jgi:DNA-binding CsgD family transcriptional regulator
MKASEEKFEQATRVWDLKRLYADLTSVKGERLTPSQKQYLRGLLLGYSPKEIAQELCNGVEGVRVALCELYRYVETLLNQQKVNSKNFVRVLAAAGYQTHFCDQSPYRSYVPPLPMPEPELPYVVERPHIEERCYQEIMKPGGLIRIKAPRQMGKTLLMDRIVQNAAKHGYQKVRLNLRQAESAVFTNLDRFLRWFCANVSRQLQLQPRLDEYWDEEIIGSSVSCTTYFEAYLLEAIDSPLVLALDEVDSVFQYREIAQDFFPLLRTWHEEVNNKKIWNKLRLLIVHSTEVYIPLNINQSPFNVGLSVELPELTLEEVLSLARLYGLDCSESLVKQLMAMVGGHPYLVHLALECIRCQDVTLEWLLQTAATEEGIYNHHLRRLLGYLLQDLELARAFQEVVTADKSVQLQSMQAYKLYSMGLVQLQGNDCIPRCNLYRQYFRTHLDIS